MRDLTAGLNGDAMPRPFAHIYWQLRYGEGHVVELGARRQDFCGTDALAMNVQPKVVAWMENNPEALVLAEGDRLANRKFFAAVRAAGYELVIALLDPGEETITQWRTNREQKLGKAQDATWLKGRETKVVNIAAREPVVYITTPHRRERLDELTTVSAVARALVDPTMLSLREESVWSSFA